MLFLVAALVALLVVLGAASYLPLPVVLVLGGIIAVWLAVFTVRERRRRASAGEAR